ncbi:MAG: nucleotidyl transferase AbiEii/AbiGii toxin family protein [Bacteroidetes bacterium]|nr:nucleotidyl transferase AbiEii/AbiGii toxin family protein [Bacteroidota bacterium]
MHSLKKDYRKLYLLQDKFLKWWADLGLPFYLTGGTALGRFYLNHRYSEDLDFFVNDDPLFLKYIQRIKDEVEKYFRVDLQHALFTDDFLLGRDNSVCSGINPIIDAKPLST